MGGSDGRLAWERRTIRAMIGIYCRDHHGGRGPKLCDSCGALWSYAQARVARCPYGADKPTCFNCPIHCYRKEMRERVREVMRYAGPRMLRRHPVLAIRHILDGRRVATRPSRHRAAGDADPRTTAGDAAPRPEREVTGSTR